MMDERKMRILQAIIDSYIDSAEPVGSRFIARRYNLGVSPATIRNEMADLEEMGYLEQPHTSAGRVPSDKGYRFYVDFMLGMHELAAREIAHIDEWYRNRAREIDLQIQRTAKILSQMTHYTSLILGPTLSEQELRYLQILPIGERTAVIVLVNETGIVEHRNVDLPEGLREDELNDIAQIMNERLKGKTLNDVKDALFRELHQELNQRMERFHMARQMLEQVLQIMDETVLDCQEERMYLGGAMNILSQPEFKDVEKARSILGLLEEEASLRQVLADLAPEGITIRIGQENSLVEMQNLSMVTARYEIGGKLVGTVGVLGPTRMDYSRVVSLMERITRHLNESLTGKKCSDG